MTATQTTASSPMSNSTDATASETRLTGAALLSRVKQLQAEGITAKGELAIACGYYGIKSDGDIRAYFTAWSEALLNAKGIDLSDRNTGVSKVGPSLSYTTEVQDDGTLCVPSVYTNMLDVKPGDKFLIKLGLKLIRFVPLTEGLLSEVKTWGVSNVAIVNDDRTLSLESQHTAMLDLQPGARFTIKLSANGSIRLVPITD